VAELSGSGIMSAVNVADFISWSLICPIILPSAKIGIPGRVKILGFIQLHGSINIEMEVQKSLTDKPSHI